MGDSKSFKNSRKLEREGNEQLIGQFSDDPNPLLRVEKDGTIVYANRAAFLWLEHWGVREKERLPQTLRHSVLRVLAQKSPEYLEFTAGKRMYSAKLSPLPEEGCVNIYGIDISRRVEAEEKLRLREKQYLALSKLARISAVCKNFQSLLDEVNKLVAHALNVRYSEILQLLPEGNFLLKSGYDWGEGLVGNAIIRGKEGSQAGYTLLSNSPVVTEDIETEKRFECEDILRDNGIFCGMTALIGSREKPFGVIGVYSTEKREFTEDDRYFLDSATFFLSEIIERRQAEEKLRFNQAKLEKLVEKSSREYIDAKEKLTKEIDERKKIGKILRNNLQFLEILLNTIPAPVFYKDNGGRYMGCNEVFANQILGLPKEKVLGKTLPSLPLSIPEELTEYCHKVALELTRTGGNRDQEVELLCADGKIRDFMVNRATFKDEEGAIAGMVGVMQDVTQRRRAEEALRNTVSFLEALIDGIPSPVFQRSKNGIYLNCNETFASQIMGLPKEKVIGGPFEEFQKRIPEELAEIYQLHDQELLKQGGSHYCEMKVVCADGVKRDFLLHKATYKDSSGNVSGIAGIMLDISQRKAAEEIFRKSEERYRIVAEQTGQLVYDYDISTGEIDWEGAIKELTGYSPEEFRQVDLKGWRDHIHPEDVERVWEIHEKCMRTGEKFLAEYRFRRKDGSYFYVEDSSVYLRNEKGQMNRIIGVIKNISEKKIAREILEKSEERFRAVAERTGQLIYDYDLKTKRSTWEGAIEKLTGYSYEEFQKFVPEVWAEHLHPEDRQRAVETYKKCLATGEDFHKEYRLRRKDGSYFYAEDNGFYIKDKAGKVYRTAGVIKDISERNLTQEKLVESEELFRLVAEQTGQGVYDYDVESDRLSWAGAVEEILGYEGGDPSISSRGTWEAHIHPEDRKRAAEYYRHALKVGEKYHQEYRLRRKDGRYVNLESNGVFLKDEKGRVYRLLGSIKDITERKLAAEKLEKSEEKYRTAAEQTGQIVFEQDLKSGVIDWAGAIRELTGYSAEEFREFDIEKWEKHVHPEDSKRAVERITEALMKGEKFVEEYRFRRKDGDYFYVESCGIGMLDEDGKSFRALGVMKDITERKLAAEKLEKSEDRYRLAAEQTGHLVFDYEIDTGKTDWAGAIEELTGYGKEEFQKFGQDEWISHIHPEERMKVLENIKKSLESGDRIHEIFRFKRKDGSYFYVEDSGTVLKDENGRPYRIVGVKKDVTERKLAQEKLERSEERYRIAAEQTGQIVYDYDRATMMVDWAGAITELTGYTHEEFREFNRDAWIEQLHPEDRKKVIGTIIKSLEKGERFGTEFRLRKKDGTYIHIEDRGVWLKDGEGKPYRALGVMKDITERKAAQEKIEKNEERYRLAARQTGQMVYDYYVETGKNDWAGAIEELTGYTREEFEDFNFECWTEHIHPEDRKRAVEAHYRALEEEKKYHEEYRFRRKDGTYFPVEDSGILLRDDRGRIYRMLGVVKDITEQKHALEKLERSEERYRLIAEHTGQVLYHDDYRKGTIEWAGAIPEITGYGFEEFQEITANGWLGLIHPEDREKVIEAYDRCRKNGGDFFEEYRLKRADGSYVTVEDEGVYLKDENGNISKALGVIKDIEEKKLARKKLLESEERFRVAAEQTGQIVFEHDHINDVLTWSGAITEITGYSIEEFREFDGKTWAEHVHPEDRKRVLTELKKSREKDSRFRVEYRFRKKDGSYFHVEDSGVYLRNEEGQIRKAVGVIKDITPIKLAAEKLRKSEERFRIAAEKTGQLVYDFDISSEKIRWAGAIEDISGYTHEEIHKLTTGKLWKEHIHPEDYKKVVAYFANALKTGGSYCQEYRFKRKSGSYIYVEDCGIYLRDEEGRVYRMIGVIKNITERKHGMEELRRSEEKFRIVAEQTGQLVYDYDIPGDKIGWGGAIKELMDYGDEEFKKLSSLADWKELLHPEDRKRAVDAYKRCLEKGEKYREEYRLKRKDGTYLYVENRGVFLKDENGRIYRMLGANKDITQLKHSLEKVRESEEKYRSFIQNFKGIAFQGNMDFTALFMHGSLEEITGYREEDFYPGGLRWDQIIHPEDLPAVLEDADKLRMVPGATTEREYRIRKKDGKVCWVHEIVQNISDESGKPVLVQGSIYDVTERKEAEEALARTEEIRKKEIHHRIKNNLQVISSLLELQAEKFKDREVIEAFRESQNRVASMAIIHEELYRAGDTETLDFSAYLRKLTSDLLSSYTVRKEDVNLKLEAEDTFLGMDTAIPLGIIINELVSNALKHAFPAGRRGEIQIRLCRKEISENKNTGKIISNNYRGSQIRGSQINNSYLYSLVVSDNGLGFPENIDFKNTDSLGLQLVNTLVEQLEGTIEMEKNGGTTFRISFKEAE